MKHNEGMLRAGQTVRYAQELWRVEYVNFSRAFIVPLRKRTVTIGDREFEGERRGVSIAPNSILPVITNIEQARTELELEQARQEAATLERQIRELNAMTPRERDAVAKSLNVTVEIPKPNAKPVKHCLPKVRGGGWKLVAGPKITFRAGSLAEIVMTFITANPGRTTKEIVAEVKAEGAVAACVSRFFQAGYIERV
jgi:hypothetical protein